MLSQKLPLFQVDAFTDRPFAGNPAAVCLLPAPRPADWMQAVAAEMNLSETAFLVECEGEYGLRWFTPGAEVDLCGHATLAAAHVLWEEGELAPDAPARFYTASGPLTAARSENGWIRLDFPSLPARPVEVDDLPAGLIDALGTRPVAAGRSRFDLLVELGSAAAVTALEPDLGRLGELDVRGVIVTAATVGGGGGQAAGAGKPDFVSRFFAPAVGVPEDPVTGSAHCVLAPWWAERLGRAELVGRQVSRRGGTVRVELAGDRVGLAGQAVTVLRGDLVG